MTKSKTIALALALQLLGLIALTQTWVSISMASEGKTTSLGDFDGSTTYPTAMPLALFAISAVFIAAISRRVTRVTALALASLAELGALAFVLPQVLTRSISALDSQLDRLTGIANTHGIEDVSVSYSSAPWLWALAALLSAIWLAFALFKQGSWQQQETTDRYSTAKTAKKNKADTSTIEIWDSQRD
ncbi:MAG: Trp biosynthesis-associated membrane protein [Rhodoluna sp.]|nr:Trp biosynthesis-associated membrane protein [Rhodoluna sp.]MBP6186775.1 Trp biosynthesis-associated membrane protein [Rhodoluna sp.]